MAAVVAAVPLLVNAQSTDYFDGYDAGREAAKRDVNGTMQFLGGFFLGIFYLGYAVFAPGQAPDEYHIESLRSRPGEYRQGFMEGYEVEWRRLRTNNALIGAGANLALTVLFYMWVIAL
jgi:hypothetical protein